MGIAGFPDRLAAQAADVIRGQVTGPDSLPIEGVNVTVTSISGNVSRTARTDRNGRFTVTFPAGEGDYMVSFAALGYAQRRFELKRTADQEILVADARLQSVAARLDAVEVTADRQRVSRNDPVQDVSGTEQAIRNDAVPIDQLGDLAAMAASLPGVSLAPGENGGPDGFSVLGLGADQNNTTLNGMQFGGSSLPRDAAVSSSLVTTPYDVSRGGFSGGQFSLRTRPGSNFLIRGMSTTLDAPQLQWTDRAGRALGQQYSNFSAGGLASGPIRFDRAFYSLSWQLGRRASDQQSLLNSSALALQTAGVAMDSVSRLLGILGGYNVPGALARFGENRTSDQGSLLGSLDFAPPTSSSGQAFNLSFNAGWNRQNPAAGGPTDMPASTGERTSWRAGLQGRHSGYFNGILTETSAGVNQSRSESRPFLGIPSGRVRVSSEFDDGSSSVQTLSFGGSPFLNSTQRNSGAEINNALSWFSTDNKHRLRLTTELRYENSLQEQGSNVNGTFVYNSLADLEAGRPASFSRQLGLRERDVSAFAGGISLGDSYRRSSDLQIQYGVRVDGSSYTSVPAYNEAVEQTFGLRNDRVPSRLYVSPRVGFSWAYGKAPEVSAFAGAMRRPRAVVRGGVGVFQSTPGASLVAQSVENTGLPGAVRQLTCLGAAVPNPDWSGYASDPSGIPETCADGTLGTVFANSAPNVTLFSRDFAAPRSLRSNLQWSGPILENRFIASVDATYSRNMNQQGAVDLNFRPESGFTLGAEGGRPVFAQSTSIVPATGTIATRDARVSPLFSRVSELRSDLTSESRQLSLRVSPAQFNTRLSWSLSYVFADVREQFRGFNSTSGNPLTVEWGRSSMASRHQLVYSLGYNFFDAVRVNWFGSFRSGVPFTPMVAGDINGDGYNNDRAFVFDPASAQDPAVAAGMRDLLDDGSGAARECLARQLGSIASRNSCVGPWTSTATMSVSLNPAKIRLPQRASVSFQLSNPLGAADLMMHGSRGLKGWGQAAFPDQSLLYVRGFDPGSQRYRYHVNPRFGSSNPAFSAYRSPVTLSALVRIDVGPTRERQMLTQQLDRGRRTSGDRAPEMLLRAIYGTGGIANPMAAILRQQDSLRLTSSQADSIATMNRAYIIRVDSIWAPVVRYMAELPERYDHDEAYSRYLSARRATVDLLTGLAPIIKDLLTAEQRRKLPANVASLLEPRYLASIRSGSMAFTSMGGGMPITGGGPMGMMPAGGGGTIQIFRQ
jgi:hypothetical protein